MLAVLNDQTASRVMKAQGQPLALVHESVHADAAKYAKSARFDAKSVLFPEEFFNRHTGS